MSDEGPSVVEIDSDSSRKSVKVLERRRGGSPSWKRPEPEAPPLANLRQLPPTALENCALSPACLQAKWLEKFHRPFLTCRTYRVGSEVNVAQAIYLLRNDPFVPGVLAVHGQHTLGIHTDQEIGGEEVILAEPEVRALTFLRANGLACEFSLASDEEFPHELCMLLADPNIRYIDLDLRRLYEALEDHLLVDFFGSGVENIDLYELMKAFRLLGATIHNRSFPELDQIVICQLLITPAAERNWAMPPVVSASDSEKACAYFDLYALLETNYEGVKFLVTEFNNQYLSSAILLPSQSVWATTPVASIPVRNAPLPPPNIPTLLTVPLEADHGWRPGQPFGSFGGIRIPPSTQQSTRPHPDIRARDVDSRFDRLVRDLITDFHVYFGRGRNHSQHDYEQFFEQFVGRLHRSFVFGTATEMQNREGRLRRAFTQQIVKIKKATHRFGREAHNR